MVSPVLAEWLPSGSRSKSAPPTRGRKHDEAPSELVARISSHSAEESYREIPDNDALCLPSAPCKPSRKHAELKGTVLQQIQEEEADVALDFSGVGASWGEGERIRRHVPLWMRQGRWDDAGGSREGLLRLRSRAWTMSGRDRPHRSRARTRSRRTSRGDRRRHSRSRSRSSRRTRGDRRRRSRARSMSMRRNRAYRRRRSRRRSRSRRMIRGDRRRHSRSRSRSRRMSRGDRRRTRSRRKSRDLDERATTTAEMHTYLEYDYDGRQSANVSLDHGVPIFASCLPPCMPTATPIPTDSSLGPPKS